MLTRNEILDKQQSSRSCSRSQINRNPTKNYATISCAISKGDAELLLTFLWLTFQLIRLELVESS